MTYKIATKNSFLIVFRMFMFIFFITSCSKVDVHGEINKFASQYEKALNSGDFNKLKKLFRTDVEINYYKYNKKENTYKGIASHNLKQFLEYVEKGKSGYSESQYKIEKIELVIHQECKKAVLFHSLNKYKNDKTEIIHKTTDLLCLEKFNGQLMVTRADFVLLSSEVERGIESNIKVMSEIR